MNLSAAFKTSHNLAERVKEKTTSQRERLVRCEQDEQSIAAACEDGGAWQLVCAGANADTITVTGTIAISSGNLAMGIFNDHTKEPKGKDSQNANKQFTKPFRSFPSQSYAARSSIIQLVSSSL